MDVADHLRAAGAEARLPDRAVRRVAAAVECSATTLVEEQARARQAEKLPRRQQHVSLHGQRVPLRAVQEPDRQGAGLRAGLAFGGAHAIHHERRGNSRRRGARRDFALDPERAAGLQAERHRQGRDRQLHRACHAGGRAPDRPRKAHRPHRDLGARARAVLLPRDHRRDRRLLHQPSLHRKIRRDAGEVVRPADLGSDHRAAQLHRHGVRHLPPGRGVRGHRRVAAEARRRRHSDLQAAGSGRVAHSRT